MYYSVELRGGARGYALVGCMKYTKLEIRNSYLQELTRKKYIQICTMFIEVMRKQKKKSFVVRRYFNNFFFLFITFFKY